MKNKKKLPLLFSVCMITAAMAAPAAYPAAAETELISEAAGLADADTSYLAEPLLEEDQGMPGGVLTTWDCVYFGSYPTCEVTDGAFTAVEDYAVSAGDVLVDKKLYGLLESAEWTDDETAIGGARYRRMKAEDAQSWAADRPQHYAWDDEDTWHYFLYRPIKWRVIEVNDNTATLLSDREMDCAPYNTESDAVSWEDCTLRSFLNGYDAKSNLEGIDYSAKAQDSFFDTAFSDAEKACLVREDIENPDNSYYGTQCGDACEDYVYILDEEDVFASSEAVRHGFHEGHGLDDPARRFRPTMYAMARGTWYSPVAAYKGNGFWFMRTNGYSSTSVTYICDFGYIYARGTDVTCNDSGILPAITVDLTKADLKDAGTVCSDEILVENVLVEEETEEQPETTLAPPRIEENADMPGGHTVTWDCVTFGSYPTAEITDRPLTAVDEYAIPEGGVVADPALYESLEKAEWTDDETVLDGVRYRRMKETDPQVQPQHYTWDEAWHYFRYDPIKWRVIETKDGQATLMADRIVECAQYNTRAEDVYWENCTLRSFLNGYDAKSNLEGIDYAARPQDSFFGSAFTEEEKKSILTTDVTNPANYYFGTYCGGDTQDNVYILSEPEVFSSPAAAAYGFVESDGVDDAARRFIPTMYALARGAWYSPLEGNRGNGFWILRANGYTPSNVVYVCDFGYIYNRGIYITTRDFGIVPVIRVDLSKGGWTYAGTVSSEEVIQG